MRRAPVPFLVAAVLASSLSCLAALAARAEVRLGRDVVPTSQAIRLHLDADQTDYTGSVDVQLQVAKSTKTIQFHARGITLDKLALTQKGQAITAKASEADEHGLVTLTLDRALAVGAAKLAIDFHQKFNTSAVSIYRMDYEGHGYVFAQFESDDARGGFPCWDEPSFKIPYQFTIELPAAHMAVTNTPVKSETPAKDGWKTVVFKPTPPTPSYLLTVACGPLEAVPIEGLSVPGRVITVKGQSHLAGLAIELAPPVLKALEAYFGTPYPYEKLDLIAVPEYWAGAMENPGAITYRDNALLVDPKAASAAQRQTLARYHAHEFAHMWFGDWVTMQWWDDVWLNESFADWMGDKITNELHPELGLRLGELQTIQNIMTGDARPSTHAIQREVVNASEGLDDVQVAYYKGKSVLGMFEAWMGPEVFRKGVNEYLKSHAWKNAVAADFWQALGKASGRDVAGALEGFIAQPGLPLVSAEPQPDGSVTLTQKRFLNYGVQAPALSWQIPVGLKYSDGTTTKTTRVLLKEPTQNVKLEGVSKLAWVMPNADAVGYYRWSVPSDMMLELAKSSVRSLDAAERVAFLGDLEALLNAGQITGDAYLRALAQFADDPEPAVTSAVIGGLGKVRQSFVSDDLRGAFAPYVRQVLSPASQRIGFDRKAGESERAALVRPQLMTWLGYYGRDEATLKAADRIAKSYLADPSSVDPGAAGSALGLVATKGDRAMFDDFRQRFETSKVPADRSRFLSALGRFEDPALEREALNYSLQPAVRPTDMFQLVTGVASRSEAAADRTFAFQRENYDKVMAKLPPVFARYMVNAANGCSLEKLEIGRTFFMDPKRKVPGSEHEFAQVEDAVRDCAGLRQREGPKVAAYLNAPVGAR